MLENRHPSKNSILQTQENKEKGNVSSKKVEFNLPQVQNRKLNRKHSQNNQFYQKNQNQKENVVIFPKIKIDSMPHIQEHPHTQSGLPAKPKRSERVFCQKNTFLIEVQNNLKKVLQFQLFSNISSSNNLENDQGFQKNISGNKNLIKNYQLKKIVSMAQKNVKFADQKYSERKRQLSIQYQAQQYQHIEKQNDKSSQNRAYDSSKSKQNSAKQLNPTKSAKNLKPNQKQMIKKCRSFQKIGIVRNHKKQNKSVMLTENQKNVSLYKGIYDFLQKPNHNRQKQRQAKVVDSIQKCKQDLQKKLQLVQQRIRQKMGNDFPENGWEKICLNGVGLAIPIVKEQLFKSDKKKNDPWSQTKFQKQWDQLNNYQKRNEDYLSNYLEQRKQLVSLQLKKKQISLKRSNKSAKQIQS